MVELAVVLQWRDGYKPAPVRAWAVLCCTHAVVPWDMPRCSWHSVKCVSQVWMGVFEHPQNHVHNE
jgi:hypothetical protein